MRIALLSPKGPLYRHDGGIFRRSLRAAPLTLTTLAALVPEELEARVQILDEGVERLPDRLDVDLVGITVITGCAPRAYEVADRYRALGMKVVLGGPHVTLVPDDAASHADAIVTGYAESTWPQLLRDFAGGRMRARYDMEPDFDLSDPARLPIPRRDLLRKRAYRTTATLEATRGCIHQCEFCVVPSAWAAGPYQKPVQAVIDDIRRVGSKRIIFYDLNLIANRAYAKELFAALEPLKVRWFGLATSLVAHDAELLDLLHRSGCGGLLIGFESLSPEGLDEFNKSFHRPSSYGEVIRRLRERGIAINGTFVFGTDVDDAGSFDRVRDFVLEHHIDLPRFSILTPFPGTPLYHRLASEGRILSRDWSLYDGQHVVHQPARLSVEELIRGHERIWREVYSYGSILRRCRTALRDKVLLLGANLGYRYYAHKLSRVYTCTGGVA